MTPRLHRWQIKESSWIIQDHPKNEKPLPSINIQNQFLDLTKKIFQRARRPRRARRVPHKVDKSLQCNIQQTNQLPSDLPNQVGFCKLCFLLLSRNSYGLEYFFIEADPDTDSGYCSPQQRAQKSSTESGLAKATSPQSPTPPGAPPNLSPSGVPQNSNPKPPSYSQVVKDSSASTPQQPPNPLSCGSGKTMFFNTFHSEIINYDWYVLETFLVITQLSHIKGKY